MGHRVGTSCAFIHLATLYRAHGAQSPAGSNPRFHGVGEVFGCFTNISEGPGRCGTVDVYAGPHTRPEGGGLPLRGRDGPDVQRCADLSQLAINASPMIRLLDTV